MFIASGNQKRYTAEFERRMVVRAERTPASLSREFGPSGCTVEPRSKQANRVVGWSMGTSLASELILKALDMAIEQRKPAYATHHPDQGCQCTRVVFGNRCQEAGVQRSVASVGDAYDDEMAESLFATLERELLNR